MSKQCKHHKSGSNSKQVKSGIEKKIKRKISSIPKKKKKISYGEGTAYMDILVYHRRVFGSITNY